MGVFYRQESWDLLKETFDNAHVLGAARHDRKMKSDMGTFQK
jgi:hypothetical protein